MKVLSIDPGNTKSAWLLYGIAYGDKLGVVEAFGYEPNEELLPKLAELRLNGTALVIEYPQPRGQPMYTQLVDTIFWIGRFVQSAAPEGDWKPIDRKDIKMTLCGNTKAKDSNIRAALISRFGGAFVPGRGEVNPIGTKRNPGPLYGLSGDIWSALAVAVTYSELYATKFLD